jgi:GAF domain-containing protein
VSEFPLGPNEIERLRVLHASGLVADLVVPGLDGLCAEAARHFDVNTAIVTLLDTDIQVFLAKFGIGAAGTPRKVAFCNFTILSDQVFVVPDALADERFASNPLVTGPPFIRFYAGAPLIFRDEVRLGALCLLHTTPRSFSLGDRAELQEMADGVTDAISNAWFALDVHP